MVNRCWPCWTSQSAISFDFADAAALCGKTFLWWSVRIKAFGDASMLLIVPNFPSPSRKGITYFYCAVDLSTPLTITTLHKPTSTSSNSISFIPSSNSHPLSSSRLPISYQLNMLSRLLVAIPATATLAAAAYAPRRQPAQPKPVRQQTRRRLIHDDEDVLDLKHHQRPPMGSASLKSGFAVELCSW